MKFSKHATTRIQQRGFRADDVSLIVTYGSPVRVSGNATEYRMSRKDGKRLVQAVGRVSNKAVLVSHDDNVVSVYNLTNKR